jgi:hypothetical protein
VFCLHKDEWAEHTTQQEEATSTMKNTKTLEAQTASTAVSTNSFETPDDDQ